MYRYLQQHGVLPWLDQADLLPGQNWKVEIPKAIFSSDVILVCLSKNSVNKEGYVQKEIVFALDKALEKPEGTIFIIPVKLEECEVPPRLGKYQWVDYFRPDGKRRLLLGLNLRAADLGDEVSPVLLDITRRRKPVESDLAGREARENATREEAMRKAAEKLAREKEQEAKEKAEREAAEIAAREKQEREQKERADRETKERLAREKAEREAAQKAEREQKEREATERAARKEPARRQTSVTATPGKAQPYPPAPKGAVSKPSRSFPAPMLALGGVILLGLLFWGIGVLFNREPSAPPEQSTAIVTNTPTVSTRTSTATRTPVPPTFTPTPGIGSTVISEKDGMVMVFVPAGEFTMGSDSYSDEQPIHQVNLDAFWIDQTEVTNAMYAKCVSAGGCTPPSSSSSYTREDYFGNSQFDDYPVIYVNWNQANAYCKWAGRSLPTEAQWEKAARGTDGRTYPWGESISCDKANYNFSCVGDTTKVGSYLDGVSPYGVYDMAGNVWEWVNDWYDSSYYQTSPSSNPQGPTSRQYRVLRGGSWNFSDFNVRSASRSRGAPASTFYSLGFRCSLSP